MEDRALATASQSCEWENEQLDWHQVSQWCTPVIQLEECAHGYGHPLSIHNTRKRRDRPTRWRLRYPLHRHARTKAFVQATGCSDAYHVTFQCLINEPAIMLNGRTWRKSHLDGSTARLNVTECWLTRPKGQSAMAHARVVASASYERRGSSCGKVIKLRHDQARCSQFCAMRVDTSARRMTVVVLVTTEGRLRNDERSLLESHQQLPELLTADLPHNLTVQQLLSFLRGPCHPSLRRRASPTASIPDQSFTP